VGFLGAGIELRTRFLVPKATEELVVDVCVEKERRDSAIGEGFRGVTIL
jgi:hypothetical protein